MASFEVGVRYSTVRNMDFDQLDLWLFVAGEHPGIFHKRRQIALRILCVLPAFTNGHL